MINRQDKLLAIVGCTAGGKSDLAERLAVELAHRDGIPPTIMAVDSMQVYRLMDIGTAKPDAETRRRLPHAMIDVADPSEAFSAARFAEQAGPIIAEHCDSGRRLILVVGTVLYFRAITEGLFQGPAADANVRRELENQAAINGTTALHQRLATVDPQAAAKIHSNDLRRLVRALEVYILTGRAISSLQTQWQQSHPRVPCTIIGIDRPREELNRRINQRVRNMMAA
ncbi:MAG: tRNA (adenosine(37)-N6)-dimethylallyltransferase MiaA, partial [Phycisphaerales bacterium]|nr:tRNA (adenosine(37)-N6)-dimethylallyltransferase MiaA [Phycisphaerales bacterium]